MNSVYNLNAPKKPTNLSINSDLLKKARDLKINLSATLEQALTEIIKKQQEEAWIESNKEAISAYNEYTTKNGLFSDKLRGF